MTAPHRADEVVRSVFVPASADDVWGAVADDTELSSWFGADVHLEPAPGGRGLFRLPGGETWLAEVEVAAASERLAWRWWPLGADRTQAGTVDLTLTEVDGGTVVTVVERRAVQPTAMWAGATAGPATGRVGGAGRRAVAPISVTDRLDRLCLLIAARTLVPA